VVDGLTQGQQHEIVDQSVYAVPGLVDREDDGPTVQRQSGADKGWVIF